jgi:predicted DNA-binding transcriptional regulator AlpA
MAKTGAIPEDFLPLKELADALRRPIDRPVLDELLTAKKLAAELGLNRRTVDRWHRAGTGPPRTLVGRQVYYRRDTVRQWLAEQEQQSGVSSYSGKRRGRRPRADD